MVLQLISVSIVPLVSQAYALQNYNYHPLNSSLDPITAQIIKTQDSALEIMKLIESGKAGEFLENEKKTVRSYTWIGKLMDKLFGWGEYHPDFQEETVYIQNKGVKRNLLDWNCSQAFNAYGYINASFTAQKFLNNSCSRSNITQYLIAFAQGFSPNAFSPNSDIICRLNTCVRTHFMAHLPNCLPCRNATNSEINTYLNQTWTTRNWESKLDNKLEWQTYTEVRNHSASINAWVYGQIQDFLISTTADCEEEELKRLRLWYLTLLILPFTAGIITCGVCISRRKKPSTSYDEIPS